MKKYAHIFNFCITLIICLLIIALPLASDANLMFGVQAGKSFLFLYGIILTTGISSIFWFISKKRQANISIIDFLFFLFIAWITINKYLIHNTISLSLNYYELIGLFVLYIIIRQFLQNKYVLLLISICISGLVQSIHGIFQLSGSLPSNNNLFKMTGGFLNPGPLGGYMAVIITIAFGLILASRKSNIIEIERALYNNSNKSSDKKLKFELYKIKVLRYISLATLAIGSIILIASNSRAACISAIVGIFFILVMKFDIKSYANIHLSNIAQKSKRLFLITVLVITLSALLFATYSYKKDSADGRLLIWRTTMEMIKDYPIFGVGQNMFQSHYMEYQAKFLSEHSNFEIVANENSFVFNEILKVLVENGIIGLVLGSCLFAFLLLMFSDLNKSYAKNNESESTAYKQNEDRLIGNGIIEISTLLSIIVFGLFSYPSEILPLKLIFIVLLAIIQEHHFNRKSLKWEYLVSPYKYITIMDSKSFLSYLVKSSLVLLILFTTTLAYWQMTKLKESYKGWQFALEQANIKYFNKSILNFKTAYKRLSRDGDFLFFYGKALSDSGRDSEAIEILNEASKYKKSHALSLAIGNSNSKLGKNDIAVENYLKALAMIPSRILPEYFLLIHFLNSDQKYKARVVSQRILEKPIKVKSEFTDFLINEVKKIDQYLNDNGISFE